MLAISSTPTVPELVLEFLAFVKLGLASISSRPSSGANGRSLHVPVK